MFRVLFRWRPRHRLRQSTPSLFAVSTAILLFSTGVGLVAADSNDEATRATPNAELATTIERFTARAVARSDQRRVIADMFGTPSRQARQDRRKIDLGHRMFQDPRLSQNGAVSCSTCHILTDGGDDNMALSMGVSGTRTGRNSPTVFNLDGHVAYFWDGRAASLEEQIDGPIHHPDEMGSDWPSIVSALSSDPSYTASFDEVFGGPPTEARIKDALVTFELDLVTDDAPFDEYLAGNDLALTDQARTGLNLFVNLGCASCHQGPLIGGNLYQRFGIYEPYPHNEGADAVFKVPSLRNVAMTAPYFHDGSVDELGDAVLLMSLHQLGYELTASENAALVAFLQSLTSRSLAGGSKTYGKRDE
jgi:cytochrome c peroxidase